MDKYKMERQLARDISAAKAELFEDDSKQRRADRYGYYFYLMFAIEQVLSERSERAEEIAARRELDARYYSYFDV